MHYCLQLFTLSGALISGFKEKKNLEMINESVQHEHDEVDRLLKRFIPQPD